MSNFPAFLNGRISNIDIDIPGYYPGRISYPDINGPIGGNNGNSQLPGYNYSPGQLGNDISNLTQDALKLAQQGGAGNGETQQGGTSGGGSGSGDSGGSTQQGGAGNGETQQGGSGGGGSGSGNSGGITQQGNSGDNYVKNSDGSFSATITSAGSRLIANNINGNPLESNAEIVSSVDRINHAKTIVYATLKEKFSNMHDGNEIFKDIIENGEESDTIDFLSPENRKTVTQFIQNTSQFIKDSGKASSVVETGTILKDTLSLTIKETVKEIDALNKYAIDLTKANELVKSAKILENPALLDELYSPLGNFLENDYKWGPPQRTSFFSKLTKNAKIAYAVNQKVSTLPGISGGAANLLKRVKFLGSVVEGLELLGAICEYEANKNGNNALGYFIDAAALLPDPIIGQYFKVKWYADFLNGLKSGDEKADKVINEGIEFATSFIPIPFLDQLGGTLGKKIYAWGADTLRKKFVTEDLVNPFDLSKEGNYVSKDVNEGREKPVLKPGIVGPAPLPETNSSTITLVGGISINNRIINNNTDRVVIQGGNKGNIVENYASKNTNINSKGTDHNIVVNLQSQNAVISAGNKDSTGSNFVYNVESDDATIYIDGAKGTVNNFHSFRDTITAGNGDDQIDNFGSFNMINAGGGNNVINSIGLRISVTSGSGDDKIDTTGDSVEVNSGAGDDYIVNEAGNLATINSGDGNDTICNNENSSNVSIDGGKGDDYIENFGDLNTINASEGSDVVNNVGNGNSVYSDFGDDYIENIGQFNTVMGAAGEDYILNVGDNNLVDAGNDNDYIVNIGNDNTMVGGSGNDTIDLRYGTDNVINYTKGNDYIQGFNETSTLRISDGKGTYSVTTSDEDVIVTVGEHEITLENALRLSKINIDGQNMNPSILSEGDDLYSNIIGNVTIYALGGNDSIENSASYVTIVGGHDNDTIDSGLIIFSGVLSPDGDNITVHSKGGKYISIDGGNGDDYINNDLYVWDEVSQTYKHSNELYYSKLNGGAGDDTIYNRGSKVTIRGGSGNDSIDNRGSDVTIDGGKDDDRISSSGDNVTINGGAGNDDIANAGSNVTINGGAGDDDIGNNGSNVIIVAGEGDDTIHSGFPTNNIGSLVTINSGNGDDRITNYGNSVSIDSGADNDSIYSGGNKVTIISGAGNDSITNNGSFVTIDSGAGDDSIRNWDALESSINAGKGNDTILIDGGTNSNGTIDAGDDDDVIINGSPYYKIKGNETIIGGYNRASSDITINGGTGNDTVENHDGANITFIYNAGDGIDVIKGFNENSILQIGDGNSTYSSQVSGLDIIVNVGKGSVLLQNAASLGSVNIKGISMYITGTNGAESISNSLSGATITGLDGNDSIENIGSFVSINGGSGNKKIINSGISVTMTGGDGADIIANAGNAGLINAGNGNNSIGNAGDTVSVFAGNGNDIIVNEGNNVTINVADGYNQITNKGSANSIIVDSGNNTIQNYGEATNIKSGTNSEFIMNAAINTTITSGNGADTVVNYFAMQADNDGNFTKVLYNGNNILIDSGTSSDLIENYGALGTINGSAGNDTIKNFGILLIDQNGNIVGTAPIENYHYQIDAGDGDNLVYNENNSATITSGTGADLIENIAATVSVNTGDGANTIANIGSTVTIQSGSGEDSIENSGSNVTINGGANNDTIYNGHVLYDELVHFDGSSQWMVYSLGGKNISVNGSDGDDHIENNPYVWDEETQTYKHNTMANHSTLNGGAGNDTIYNQGSFVTINGGTGNDYISNGGCYLSIKSGDGDDTINNGSRRSDVGSFVTIDAGTGSNVITNNASNVSIKAYTGNDFISNGYNESVTIDAGTGVDTISNSGKNTSINSGAGNDSISAYSSEKITIEAGDGNDTIITGSIINNANSTPSYYNLVSNSTINGGKGDDYIENRGGENVTFIHNSGDGHDTIHGFNETSTLQINNATYSKEILDNDVIIKVDDGSITLKDAKNTAINIDGEEKISWKLNNAIATYGSSTKTLITVVGIKSLDGISLKDNVVTVSKAALGRDSVSISSGYILALGNDVTKTSTTAPDWSLSNSTVTYKSSSTSEGYKLNNNQISYVKANGGEALFTLSGTKTTNGIVVDDTKKTVTLKSGNLNKKNVTITNNYKLNLAKDIPTSTVKTGGAFNKFSNGTAIYKTTSYSGYYTPKNNKIIYTAATGGKTIKIAGLKTNTNLAAIKSGINITEQKDGSFKITFKNAKILADKAPTITVDKGVSYTLALVDSLKPATLTPDWKINGTNASLKSDISAGYTISENKIVYSAKKTGSAQMELGGLVKNAKLDEPEKKVATLDTVILGKNASLKSNVGNYSFSLTGNMNGKKFTGTKNADKFNIEASNAAVLGGEGNDKITVSGAKVTVTGGKGNDIFSLSGKNPVLIYGAGDGNDKVNCIKGLQVSLSGSTEIKELGKKDSALVLGFGKNSSMSVTGAKETDTLKVTSRSGSVTLYAGKFDLANSLSFNRKNSSVKVAKDFTGTISPSDGIYLGSAKLSSVSTIDASAVTGTLTISGNDKANYIVAGKKGSSLAGGKGNDTLIGGTGADTLSGGESNDSLQGGKGKDVFVFSAGKDTISDYTAGDDKISVTSGLGKESYNFNKKTLILAYGKDSLTITNALNKQIAFTDGSTKTYTANGLFNANKTAVTLPTSTKTFDATKYSGLVTVDGSAASSTLTVKGNDKANYIVAGKKGSWLTGGKGNDSLWGGGSCKDTFIYASGDGKDVIYGFDNNDLLKITGSFSGTYNKSKKEVYIKVGSTANAITLKDFSATTFNVNNTNYKISGSALVKK